MLRSVTQIISRLQRRPRGYRKVGGWRRDMNRAACCMLHEREMTWAAGRQDRKYKLTIRAGPGVGTICFIVMLQVIAFVWRWGALPISLCRHVCLCSCLCLDGMLHSIVHSPPLPIKTLLSKFLEPCSIVRCGNIICPPTLLMSYTSLASSSE